MRRAERVVDVEVAALGELAREAGVVLRLARVEARVLEHVDPVVRQQLVQPRRDRRDRELARSSSVFGRPRCEQTRTSARRASSRSSSVGSEARMRVSSATRPSSSGTLRSARTSTRLPATSASRTERGFLISLEQDSDEVDQPARVAPLVVVPAEHLRRSSRAPSSACCRRCTSTATAGCRSRRADPPSTGGIPRAARTRPRAKAALISSAVDLAAERDDEVGERAGRDGRAHRDAVDLALELRQDEADRLRGAGRGRDQVDRGRAGPAQVLVRQVEDAAGRSCTRGSSS